VTADARWLGDGSRECDQERAEDDTQQLPAARTQEQEQDTGGKPKEKGPHMGARGGYSLTNSY
jgi:hypothetical protein